MFEDEISRLSEIAVFHGCRAFYAGTEEQHIINRNLCEKYWTDVHNLEDAQIIGDLSICKMIPRKPIVWFYLDYGIERCFVCGENAKVYYDDWKLECPSCGWKWKISFEGDRNGIVRFANDETAVTFAADNFLFDGRHVISWTQ